MIFTPPFQKQKKGDFCGLIFQQPIQLLQLSAIHLNHPGFGSFLFLKATRLGTFRKAMLSLEDLEPTCRMALRFSMEWNLVPLIGGIGSI